MTRDRSELVRSAYAAFERRDVQALLELLDPAVEIVDPDLPGGGTFRGHEGAARYVEEILGVFSAHTIEIRRIVEGDGAVVAVLHHVLRAGESDAEISLDDAHVWTIAGERATRIEMYLDVDAALAATRSRRSDARTG